MKWLRRCLGRLTAWWADQQRVLADPPVKPPGKKVDNLRYWDRRAHILNRYATNKGVAGFVTGKQLRQLWLDSAGRCFWCNETMRLGRNNKARRLATVDHVQPLISGGEHSIANLQFACEACNDIRGRRFLTGRAA